MSVLFYGVDILIGQVDPTGIGHFSINGNNFTVIPVVLLGRQEGPEGVKEHAFNPKLPQLLGIVLRQEEKTANIIINQAYLYTLGGLFFQN